MALLRVQYLAGQTDSVYSEENLQPHDYSIWIKRLKKRGFYAVVHDTIFWNNVMIFKNGQEYFCPFML